MKIWQIVLLAFLLSGPYATAPAAELGSIAHEKSKLQERIQCHQQTNTPASDGLGFLWGCYNQNETVKLWINGESASPQDVRDIKLAIVNYHGKRMDITGRIWARILSEEYTDQHVATIKKALEQCPTKQTYNAGNVTALVKCEKGRKADEHLLIFQPN